MKTGNPILLLKLVNDIINGNITIEEINKIFGYDVAIEVQALYNEELKIAEHKRNAALYAARGHYLAAKQEFNKIHESYVNIYKSCLLYGKQNYHGDYTEVTLWSIGNKQTLEQDYRDLLKQGKDVIGSINIRGTDYDGEELLIRAYQIDTVEQKTIDYWENIIRDEDYIDAYKEEKKIDNNYSEEVKQIEKDYEGYILFSLILNIF